VSSSDEKACPYCAETIKAAAVVCKHCGRDQPPPTTYTDSKGTVWAVPQPRTTTGASTLGRIMLFCILLPMLALAWLGGASANAAHFALTMLLIAPIVYFLPSYEAWARSHPNYTGVLLLNLFLGWTLLGWVIALVWAVSRQGTQRSRP
jgi:hypothetical protein